MSASASTDRIAHFVDQQNVLAIDVLGPVVEYLTAPGVLDDEPCVMRGTIPPGVVVPMHSHADPETFLPLSGELEGLVVSSEGFAWVAIGPGDVFHVPGHARHAFRNTTGEPAVMHLVSTARIGRFLQELGVPVGEGSTAAWPPSDEAIARFLATAARYGYWNATPEENAAVGLHLG
jgi:quercetin dioxygenase-like cupin family protein